MGHRSMALRSLTHEVFRRSLSCCPSKSCAAGWTVPRSAILTYTGSPLIVQMRGFASKKHKKMLKLAKGYRGRANSAYSVALQRVEKALAYAYRDRRTKKREYRKEWIQRINAATRQHGIVYSKMIRGMGDANITLNRKVLADLAVTEPLSFKAIVDTVKRSATGAIG